MPRTIITCSPLFPDLALNEIHRFHSDAAAQEISPGFLFLNTQCTFGAFTQPWRNKLPIYLHHAFPVREIVTLADTSNLRPLLQAVARIATPDATIQVRSTLDWESPLSEHALRRELKVPPESQPGRRVLSILVIPCESGAQAYLGLSWAAQNISPYARGVKPAGECVPNRAGYKLLEALDSFGIHLNRGDHALDLGAAPGAWTTLLRRRGLAVTAVAPGPLYSWLTLDPGVTHEPVRAEGYLGRCDQTFDLIVNDMKLDGQDSARLMAAYAAHLRPGGIALMTLKLHRANMLRTMDHALRLLRKAYKIIRVRNLVSNRHEVTLFLRRR